MGNNRIYKFGVVMDKDCGTVGTSEDTYPDGGQIILNLEVTIPLGLFDGPVIKIIVPESTKPPQAEVLEVEIPIHSYTLSKSGDKIYEAPMDAGWLATIKKFIFNRQ